MGVPTAILQCAPKARFQNQRRRVKSDRLLVEEGSARISVDESGSWRAVWLGDRPRWSLATKVALGG